MNEYEKEYRAVPQGWAYSATRQNLVKKFAWAVPNDAVLTAIANLRMPVVEMGAGTGYWARCLAERGVPIVAFDVKPYHNDWCQGSHFPVLLGTPGDLDAGILCEGVVPALLLVWPPYDDPMAYDCLRAYQGSTLIYVGESDGGCTANENFFQELRASWEEIACIQIPQWQSINDRCWVYKRREVKL